MASTPSSTTPNSTPAQERDAQLLSIGKQCSHPACLLVDFLPFKCRHCELSFCQEHFKVDAHKCEKYDETKHNRVAPNCPLCNIPVAVKPGQDPNVRMDQHLETECSVVTGKVKSKATPVCAKASCKKVLFSPIRCDKCRKQFCPAHRFPGDHICSASTTASPQPNARAPLPSFNASAKNFNTKATAAGTAALDAVKKSMANAAASSSSSSSSSSKPKFPFNKTDRLSSSSSSSLLNIPSDHDISSTASTTTTTTPTTPNDEPTTPNNTTDAEIIKPSPVIPPFSFSFSFKPRPIFAAA
ncbi:hypothetical protein CVT26_013312 [Gymnopilus dilepis]|uniref:AN1-type domain-containing protein n=1 Tax=Gymnopilus dilepis TaxID=231916 RepID=A0A409VUT9_9AGAR|nr:hypothetical protein CVT26_013312 [Gymnopilus dilepis]